MEIQGADNMRLEGKITVPGDKSISHRAVMLLGISEGRGSVKNFLRGADCLNTMACLRELGVEIEDSGTELIVHGRGLHGLKAPKEPLDVGNSGTTMRLMAGILAGQGFTSTIIGDDSLKRRPMDRIAIPLRKMGALISGVDGDYPPLTIQGGALEAIDYALPVASAQVKSAILLAGLYAKGETRVRELIPARNHTERMLEFLGAKIVVEDNNVTLAGSKLEAQDIVVPGDLSSAAFFIAAAAALPGSHLVITDVGLNPTRTGIIDVLREMGASIKLDKVVQRGGEEQGDLVIRGRRLQATTITREMIPRVVDEIPVLAVIAGVAEGITKITGAEELRVKESNRLASLVTELSKLGVRIRELPDGLEIEGPNKILGGQVESYGDHRMAMALSMAGLFSDSPVNIRGSHCISISFPGFDQVLKTIVK